jgi:hypothetical protein
MKVEGWDEKKEKLIKIFNRNNDYFKLSDNDTVITDYYSSNNYKDEVYNILREEILEFLSYCQLDLKFANCWFEESIRNMHHSIHNHGPVGFSAVCFVEYDQEVHYPTQFIAPFNDFMQANTIKYSPSCVMEGTLIFFPSVIHHFTMPNTSDKRRIALSFNLSPYETEGQ